MNQSHTSIHGFLLTLFPDFSPSKNNFDSKAYEYMVIEDHGSMLIRSWAKDIGRWVVGVASKENFVKFKGWYIKDSPPKIKETPRGSH